MRRQIQKKFPKAMKPRVQGAPRAVQPEPESMQIAAPLEVRALEQQDLLIVQLAAERLQNARLLLQGREQEIESLKLQLQNRQNDLTSLIGQVRVKYEVNGQYTMTSIDLDKGTVVRAPRESVS